MVLAACSLGADAQFAGKGPRDHFLDTSVLRPPKGSKVAVLVWEDLGCPACARFHPVEQEVAAKTHVTVVRHDFLSRSMFGRLMARCLRVSCKTR